MKREYPEKTTCINVSTIATILRTGLPFENSLGRVYNAISKFRMYEGAIKNRKLTENEKRMMKRKGQ